MTTITYTEDEENELLNAIRRLERRVADQRRALNAAELHITNLIAANSQLKIKAAAYDHMMTERNEAPTVNGSKLYEGYHAEL